MISARAIDVCEGSSTSPDVAAARSCSRVNHRASVTSTPSTVISVDVARATNASMIDAGNGHGWLPR